MTLLVVNASTLIIIEGGLLRCLTTIIMNCYWLLNSLWMLFWTVTAKSESYYSINAAGVIRSNRKYSVLVSLHQATSPSLIRVGVEGPNFKEYQNITLQPYEYQIVDFFPKKLQDTKYLLKAEGLNGLIFQNESALYEITRGPNIYIQTDKAIYKPLDVVRFRFVLLDDHSRPLDIADPIHVEILNSQRNRVKHFRNISLTHGVYTGKFQLSKYPIEGNWLIRVIIDGNYDHYLIKSIKISNYILPKFSVYLKTPSNIPLHNGHVRVAIYGMYTFYKHVEGNATIELWNSDKSMLLKAQHLDIQNMGFVDFNLKTIKNIEQNDRLQFKGILTEKYTGETHETERSVFLRKERYNLIIPQEEIEFENNKPYSIKAYVQHWTGAPVLDYKTPVTMKHGNQTYESFLDSTGAATFEFDYIANVNYKFQFKDSKTTSPIIYTAENLKLNNREYYCRLELVNKKLKLGQPVLIEVSSIVNIPYLMYTVMGHSSLVRTKYIKVPPNQKSYTLNITASIEMIPRSFLYVYYIHKGNLRYEELTLYFPREFENQISLSTPKQAKPGQEVTISIKAQPNSYVGILAVDLAVYLLDNSYDFDKLEIIQDLEAIRSFSVIGSAEYPGIISGLVTLTNAHYPFVPLDPPPQSKASFPTLYQFRKKFPDTWIFNNYFINDTETKLTLQIPDTITTWRLTAFSNNAVTGFGIVDAPTDITTIQTFFISLNLPYSVKRGEIVSIPITVFNYSNETLETEVILHNNKKQFYFMESNRQAIEKSGDEQQQIKRIVIASNKVTAVKFLIFPTKAGDINLNVTASSALYADAVLQKLKVEPEGVPKLQNQALYLSIPEGEKITSTFKITDPVASVTDSEYITFSVGGHYLVPTVDNFDHLTEMPTGTGEQNMGTFAPNVLMLQYLIVNRKLEQKKELVESLLSSLEVGYQQQLSYRHTNGGYSVYGMDTDEEPSTWLTAFVVRYFIKASHFMDIEKWIIEEDLDYLASQQQENGEFLSTGYLLNPDHENGYGLTAFVLKAFWEDQAVTGNSKYVENIERAIKFLNSNSNKLEDINDLCLVAAVTKRAKLTKADQLIKELNSRSKESNGLRWWSGNDQNPAKDIEITANAALTVLDTPGDHTAILKWLIKQRNSNGGFISCYDTVTGMEALVKFSEKYTSLEKINLKINYTAKDEQGNKLSSDEFHVDSSNVLNFQRQELPKGTRQVTFEMMGTGASLVQLSQQYNVYNLHEFRHFKIETNAILENEKQYILKLCFSYISQLGSANETTNMVIIEVNLPSGLYSEAENSRALKEHRLVKRIETKNSDSLVIIYLDKLEANMKNCLEIPTEKNSEILMSKPAAIIMYDYYNLTRSNTHFYNI